VKTYITSQNKNTLQFLNFHLLISTMPKILDWEFEILRSCYTPSHLVASLHSSCDRLLSLKFYRLR